MTRDERDQLVEDIRRSISIRERILEQAADEQFDIAAAWETLEDLDTSINARIVQARVKP
jgi:hypothetical protein